MAHMNVWRMRERGGDCDSLSKIDILQRDRERKGEMLGDKDGWIRQRGVERIGMGGSFTQRDMWPYRNVWMRKGDIMVGGGVPFTEIEGGFIDTQSHLSHRCSYKDNLII